VSALSRISVTLDGRLVAHCSTYNNAVIDARAISAGHPTARVIIRRGDTILGGFRNGRPLKLQDAGRAA
jgi:hypothetical protein